ncbi:MAG: pyridoxal-dependent decarboxylase [Planctomycetota bacterium]|nr:pyridoxal-dependent decarboxylase [Planctomycetota bacterium]MDA1178985.1 pyridoxal-dependent decarboxylase [Planctomycetota bacterium]
MKSPPRPPILEQASSPQEFRRLGHELIEQLAQYLTEAQSGNSRPTLPWKSPEDCLEFWSQFNAKGSFHELIRQTLANSVALHDPRYVGHQINPPLPVSALASLVVDLLNNGMGVYDMGMAGTAMERLLLQTLSELFGMPTTAGGFMTSGGSLANLTALLAARARLTNDNVWQRGNVRPLVAIVSDSAHYCVDRALRIMGLGTEGIYRIPVNDRFQMRTDLLADAHSTIERRGGHVFAVVANSGSTSTGSYDDLESIADFCEMHNIWLHVDGAHGAAVCFSPRHRHLIRCIERADSVTLDFHKLLMTPAITSALVFRNDQDSYRTFAQQAHYLFADTDDTEWYNLARRTFECTKHMMSLKVFSILKCHGTEIFQAQIEYLFELAKTFAEMIRCHDQMELAIDPPANIVCFRYATASWNSHQIDQANMRIREQIVRSGDFYLVQTSLRGTIWLRTTLSNPKTTTEHLATLLDLIGRTGQQININDDPAHHSLSTS